MVLVFSNREFFIVILEYQTATFGAVPSISGDVINKSTQSLMKIDVRTVG